MNPFGSRGAAGFARALDAGLDGGTAGTLPGIALAARLRTAGACLDEVVAPRAEFRDALRQRLMAVATVQANAPAVPAAAPLASAVSWRRRTGAVAAGAMASVVAVSGVAVAGSQSLPGDPFYGVKRTVEALQLSTADGDVEKGTQHLEFAATRLREVRGLTLGRDAVDGGSELGPAALDGDVVLRSAGRALASGDALSAPVAERVTETLADMDEQTREGSELLTSAYRSSRASGPLRVLNRFATRQSAGLQELIPALPPRTQDRARVSLALLTGVTETTAELLSMGTCAQGCDPSTTAPTLAGEPGTAPPAGQAPCDCGAAPEPVPAPSPSAPDSAAPAAEPTDEPQPEPTREPSPEPTSPEPSRSPSRSPSPSPTPSSGGLPLPVPAPSLPVPVPSLPVPVPTLTLAPLAPALGNSLEAPAAHSSTGRRPAAPAPAPASSPLPQLAPLLPSP